MALLEELKPGSIIKGLSSDGTAKVINVEFWVVDLGKTRQGRKKIEC